jgi:pSer/pThr/pTyr-binding forkhead associated (FHA) protein
MLAERGQGSARPKVPEKTYRVVLEGQTEEAKKCLGKQPLRVAKFPFLIGRDSQNPEVDVFHSNDLLIREEKPYVVSRNHVAVINEGGMLWVMDRGSAFGTIVNGKEIGGQSGVSRVPLDKAVNQVIIGPATSKYIFLLKPEAL